MAVRERRPAWFKMYRHQGAMIDSVPDEVLGKVVKDVFRYFETGEIPEQSYLERVVFSAMKMGVDESNGDFLAHREKNAQNAKRRWEKKEQPADGSRDMAAVQAAGDAQPGTAQAARGSDSAQGMQEAEQEGNGSRGVQGTGRRSGGRKEAPAAKGGVQAAAPDATGSEKVPGVPAAATLTGGMERIPAAATPTGGMARMPSHATRTSGMQSMPWDATRADIEIEEEKPLRVSSSDKSEEKGVALSGAPASRFYLNPDTGEWVDREKEET